MIAKIIKNKIARIMITTSKKRNTIARIIKEKHDS